MSVRYSEHQKRIHSEIDSVVGRDRSPCYADRLHMPFTQAFINESFRYKTKLPFNLMRCTTKDTTVLGHFIPKDTRVIVNTYALHSDPNVWVNPKEFIPNRFLSSDGKKVLKYETFIPFLIGKRSCVGETLGRVEVFLYFVSLLQRYRVSAKNVDIMSVIADRLTMNAKPKDDLILEFHKCL
ncbi:unnamed protein product [Oppiella nova]|uniref:Cytochrome P450 n=1 Tax=Oppiella nova TaxID=334625 RepID=A0A7R9MPB1_9ACAR|nr:unnamed protein product [Oppiella nova]CAG2181148.1 unnamed protein product [Oppiella nova]